MKNLLRIVLVLGWTSLAGPARAQPLDDDCTDPSCQLDLTVDECADPGAGCLPERELDDAELERVELAPEPSTLAIDEAATATLATALVDCADGATSVDGHCRDVGANAAGATTSGAVGGASGAAGGASGAVGGCAAARDGALPSTLALALVAIVLLRRRRALPLAILAALCGCVAGGDAGWDAALADDPAPSAAGQYLDVLAAERTDTNGAALLLAGQKPDGPAVEPSAVFSLSRHRLDGVRAIRRVADDRCGDRLVASDRANDGELLGYAAAQPASGTAALTELVAPDGCGTIYETDSEAIALYLADGWAPGAVVGWVWPPGWGDAAPADADVATDAVTPCRLGAHPALSLFYTGIDRASDFRLLQGCPGEVVLGEKHMDRPHGEFASAAAHAAGGRTALVFGGNGSQFRAMLSRTNGVERTAAFIRAKLKAGYDYIVVDEVTMDPSWRDGTSVNRRFRQLLTRIPRRTLIPYISLDLTTYAGGGQAMRDRRLLLRAFSVRARALALEDYLHTDAVMGGSAPPTFRTAANRLVAAVHGLKGAAGISTRTLTTLGLSMHTSYPQYNYLDDPRHDLASIARQVNAIRHGSARLRAERGIGFYFIGHSDITPSGRSYTLDDVVTSIHRALLRFR